jgi:hypothetical protein
MSRLSWILEGGALGLTIQDCSKPEQQADSGLSTALSRVMEGCEPIIIDFMYQKGLVFADAQDLLVRSALSPMSEPSQLFRTWFHGMSQRLGQPLYALDLERLHPSYTAIREHPASQILRIDHRAEDCGKSFPIISDLP